MSLWRLLSSAKLLKARKLRNVSTIFSWSLKTRKRRIPSKILLLQKFNSTTFHVNSHTLGHTYSKNRIRRLATICRYRSTTSSSKYSRSGFDNIIWDRYTNKIWTLLFIWSHLSSSNITYCTFEQLAPHPCISSSLFWWKLIDALDTKIWSPQAFQSNQYSTP